MRTHRGVQTCQLKLVKREFSTYPSCLRVSLLSSSGLVFTCGNIIVAIHVFHELVYSDLINEEGILGILSFIAFDSSGESAAPTGFVGSGVSGGSGTEYEVAHTTSCDKRPGVTTSPPMDLLSSVYQNCDCIRQVRVD